MTGYSRARDTMKIIYGTEESVAKGIEFMRNVVKKMDLCYDKNAPSIVLEVKEYKNGYLDVRKRGGKDQGHYRSHQRQCRILQRVNENRKRGSPY